MPAAISLRIIFISLFFSLFSAVAAADFYAAEYNGEGFYKIKAEDGSHEVIKSSLGHGGHGLAFNPLTNKMYVVGGTTLYKIKPSGDTEVSGEMTVEITGIDFNFDYTMLYGLSAGSIYSIDPVTAEATYVMETTLTADNAYAIATRSDGTMFVSGLSGELVVLDVNTEESKHLGTIASTEGGFTAMAFDVTTDTLYAIHNDPNKLVTIDLDTLRYTTIGGTIGEHVHGMTFIVSEEEPPPPEDDSGSIHYAMLLLLMMLGVGKTLGNRVKHKLT